MAAPHWSKACPNMYVSVEVYKGNIPFVKMYRLTYLRRGFFASECIVCLVSLTCLTHSTSESEALTSFPFLSLCCWLSIHSSCRVAISVCGIQWVVFRQSSRIKCDDSCPLRCVPTLNVCERTSALVLFRLPWHEPALYAKLTPLHPPVHIDRNVKRVGVRFKWNGSAVRQNSSKCIFQHFVSSGRRSLLAAAALKHLKHLRLTFFWNKIRLNSIVSVFNDSMAA